MTDRAARWTLPGPTAAGPAASSLAETAPRNSGRRSTPSGADSPSSIARSAGVSVSGMGARLLEAGEFGAGRYRVRVFVQGSGRLDRSWRGGRTRRCLIGRSLAPKVSAKASPPVTCRRGVTKSFSRVWRPSAAPSRSCVDICLSGSSIAGAPLNARSAFCVWSGGANALPECRTRRSKPLQARADASGIIRLPPPPSARVFCKGDRVKISAGQWASFDAVHTGMSTRERELVLITILGAQREVSVASHLVATR
jgi:hypothetical protein